MSDTRYPSTPSALFQPRGSRLLDDDSLYLVHGAHAGGYVFRYGKSVPGVSLPSGRLMVDSAVAECLRGAGAILTKVLSLIVSDHEVDWRAWGDMQDEEIAKLRDRYEIDDGQELVIPWGAWRGNGVLKKPIADVRPHMLEIVDPDYWLVDGCLGSLEQVRTDAPNGPTVRVRMAGCGVHRIPWLFEGDVCVDARVRRVLEQRAWPDSLEFREIRVVA